MIVPLPPSSCVVYTPARLAFAMAATLQPNPEETFLEPCVGRGSLVSALAEHGVPSEKIRALDLDTATTHSDVQARVLRGVDFLSWAHQTDERFDKVLANPPYVALSKLDRKLRESALRIQDPVTGKKLTLRSNYWHVFLCASLRVLKAGGSLCFVLPAAWDYANYSRDLRLSMPARFSKWEAHRCAVPLFEGCQDGSVVLVARGYLREHLSTRRFEHRRPDELINSLLSNGSQANEIRRVAVRPLNAKFRRFGEIAQVRIGAVTGDARYFLMTEKDRRARRLPKSSCVPVVSRGRHLFTAALTKREWEKIRDSGARVWLFCPDASAASSKNVRAYIALPRESGGCNKDAFKIRNRTPWYKVSLPSDVHAFISGMGGDNPMLCINRMPGLNASNTLYVVKFVKAKTYAERAAIAISLLTTRARKSIADVVRKYPDGLKKLEPGDFAKIEVPIVRQTRGSVAEYRVIAKLLKIGKADEAHLRADSWVNGARLEPIGEPVPTNISPNLCQK
jgi:adenine-specific DNA-methyltransferase